MNGLKGLYKNEITKTWSHKGYKILIIIILALTILIPVFYQLISSLNFGFSYYVDGIDAKQYQQLAKDSRESGDIITAEYNEAEAESLNYFSENDLEPDGWKYENFYYKYRDLCLEETAYSLIVEKNFTEQSIIDNGNLSNYITSFNDYYAGLFPDDKYEPSSNFYKKEYGNDYNNNYTYKDKPTNGVSSDVGNYVSYEKALSDVRSCKTELEKYILKIDASSYMSDFAANNYTEADNYESIAKEFEAQLQKTDKDDLVQSEMLKYNTEYNYSFAEYKNAMGDKYTWLAEKGYDFDSWQYNTVYNILEKVFNDKTNCIIQGENYYNSITENSYTPYEDYLENCRLSQEKDKEAIALVNYSLEHDIPLRSALTKSTKSSWENAINPILGIITIFMIVVAGSIVSSEHSIGAIRLLLTRPRKRSKISLSKLLTVLTFDYAVLLAVFVLAFISSWVVTGTNDLFAPDLYYVNNSVMQVNSILSILGKTLLNSLVPLLIICIAFFFSVVTKKTSITIVISIILNSFKGALALGGIVLAYYYPLSKYTIVPYLDMSIFTSNVIDNVNNSMNIFGVNFFSVAQSLSVWVGIVFVLAHAALFAAISFLVFKKQEIKS